MNVREIRGGVIGAVLVLVVAAALSSYSRPDAMFDYSPWLPITVVAAAVVGYIAASLWVLAIPALTSLYGVAAHLECQGYEGTDCFGTTIAIDACVFSFAAGAALLTGVLARRADDRAARGAREVSEP